MATKKRLDQLPAILSGDVGNNDLMYLVNENALAETGYDSKKILVAEVAKKLLGGVELPTALPDFPEGEQNALNALEYLNEKINDLYPVVTESGSLATFTTPLALPLVSLKANITATQSGTGTPSPQNIRSISGFSSVRLWNSQYAQYFKGLLLGTYAFAELGDLAWNIGSGGAVRFVSTIASQPPKSSGNIICDCYQTSTNTAIYAGSVDDAIALHTTGAIWVRDTDYETADAFKTAMDNHYAIYELATPITPTITDAQFETLCQAFGISGDAITISLGDTYYGGVIDCKNGTATITHIKETFKWSEGGAVADLGTYTRKMFVSSTMANESLVQLCNVAPYAYNYSSDSLHFYCRAYTNDTRIYLFLDEDNLPADFDEFEVIYGLATPITLSGLTPDNFTTIQGENNIFADSGDVELSFKQGIQEYIDEQIAETQALIL